MVPRWRFAMAGGLLVPTNCAPHLAASSRAWKLLEETHESDCLSQLRFTRCSQV